MNKRIRLTVVIFTLALFELVSVSQTQTPTLDTVFAKMEKANKDYPNLQGNIERSNYNDLTRLVKINGTGKIWISGVSGAVRRVKVEFDKPVKDYWSVDNGVFTDYFPGTKDGKKVIFDKDRQPEVECVFLGLCSSTSVLKQFYAVTVVGPETVNGVKTVHLDIRPKDQKREEYFVLLKLWLDADKWYPVQTQVIAKNKNYNLFKYSGLKTGSFSNSVFNISIPKGVELETHKF